VYFVYIEMTLGDFIFLENLCFLGASCEQIVSEHKSWCWWPH